MSVPEDYPPSGERAISRWYGESARSARRLVKGVPTAWPRPARLAAQAPLLVGAVIFTLAAWIAATALLLLSSLRRTGR